MNVVGGVATEERNGIALLDAYLRVVGVDAEACHVVFNQSDGPYAVDKYHEVAERLVTARFHDG